MVKCEVSMPPSSAWSQLHACQTLLTVRCASGTSVHSNLGGAGFFSAGPI
jgi:hypothetical protein